MAGRRGGEKRRGEKREERRGEGIRRRECKEGQREGTKKWHEASPVESFSILDTCTPLVQSH